MILCNLYMSCKSSAVLCSSDTPFVVCNPSQNIWHKLKKYKNKIGEDFKNIISNFACFLTAIFNV